MDTKSLVMPRLAMALAALIGTVAACATDSPEGALLGSLEPSAVNEWLRCTGPGEEIGRTVAQVDPRLATAKSPEDVVTQMMERAATDAEMARYRGLKFDEILYEDDANRAYGARSDGLPATVVVATRAGDRWGSTLIADCYRRQP
ncbi:MAG: hypothetical protein ACLGH3_08365 [Actinomycetota bacterium]